MYDEWNIGVLNVSPVVLFSIHKVWFFNTFNKSHNIALHKAALVQVQTNFSK